MRCIPLLLFLVLFSSLAVAAGPASFSSLVIDGTLTNPLEIKPSGRNPSISSLTGNISWFPVERQGQEVLFFTTVPEADLEGDALVFFEQKPALGYHSFDVEYQVRTWVDAVRVPGKISFPLSRISSDLVLFIQPTDTIDITPAIRSLAADLAQGEDDLFSLVVKIGAWTKEHVAYDLSTVNVEASQPSSFVLETRAGVCDEITNLFISLLRSLGVPARFVSGIAYTSSDLFERPWGAHGWAEVYFPGVGWVPFDVTYGQFGWVDASHVVFAADVDSGKYASGYSWLGHDVTVLVSGMQIAASIVDEGEPLDPLLEVSVRPLEEDVGIGSYQLVLATVKNPTRFYVADTVQLALVAGYEVLDPLERVVVLAPGDAVELSWRVLVDDALDKHYLYTYPLVVVSHRGALGRGEFFVKPRERLLSLSWVDAFAGELSGGSASVYDAFAAFSCALVRDVVPRAGEPVPVRCSLENLGELDLSGVSLCSDERCFVVDVPAGGSEFVVFEFSLGSPSLYSLSFAAQHALLEKRAYVSVEVVQPPLVVIENVSAPSSIDFSGQGVIGFSLVLLDGASPSEVVVSLRGPRVTNEWSFPGLVGVKHFEVTLSGDALSLRDDVFVVEVTYRDDRGQLVRLQESFSIALGDVTLWQRVLLWFSSLF